MSWTPLPLPPAPAADTAARRAVLARTKHRDTAPELALRRALWALGLRFLVDVSAPGTGRRRRVDVLLRGGRLAILVHGCFWHGCPEHYHATKANADWWALKLRSVQERDADTLLVLAAAGWLPVVVWEHEDMAAVALRLRDLQHERRPAVKRA
jgi:DNA mismatch endonuclease (patch repair protein)